MLPAVSAGRFQAHGVESGLTLFLAASLAALFSFFSLLALQGILLNVIPERLFPRVSLLVQGALLIVLLCALPFVLSIPGLYWAMGERPLSGRWLPPLWFLGIDLGLLGNGEPYVRNLSDRGTAAVLAAAAAALGSYLWSYRRHRIRVLETPVEASQADESGGRWRARIADAVMPDPQEQAVFAFMTKTLARSGHHRLVLTAYAGVAIAIVAGTFVSLALHAAFRGFGVRTFALQQAAVSVPLALSLFLLAGYRYLFRLPVELRANWVFQINEGGNRRWFLSAVERFLMWFGVAPVVAFTLPLEILLLGWQDGLVAAVLSGMTVLILRELLLYQFQKIPFTCSYLPGRRNLVETMVLYGAGVAIYISLLSGILVACLGEPPFTVTVFGLLLAAWAYLRRERMEDAALGKIEFEEQAEPAVHTLSIDADW
jgi:hypothetical protein